MKTRTTADGRRNRAVSETIGFVFAFALVTASVGVVYTTGIGGLEDAREDEQLTNAVRAFDVLHDNIGDVTREDAPSRATELKLNDASLGYGDPVRIRIQANDSDPDHDNASYATTTRPLVYSDSAGEVVFSAGATFRVDDGNAAMRAEPDFVVDDRRSAIPLLLAYPRGNGGGVGGSSTVLVVAYRQSAELKEVFEPSGSTAEVNITIESPRAEAWGRYFEQQNGGEVDVNADEDRVTYEFETGRLFVPQTAIEFELQR